MRKLVLCWLVALTAMMGKAGAQEATEEYVDRLKQVGFADLAIDYLKMQLQRPNLSADERATIEFEIASSTIAASEELNDLSKREQMLEDARRLFADFAKKYPNHPKQPDSLSEVATIDLQKGRLRVVEAQLPANDSRAIALVQEGREFLEKAAAGYAAAHKDFQKAHKEMPTFIDPELRGSRELQKRKDSLFLKSMDSRFQTELCRFYIAESYESVPLPKPQNSNDKKAMEEYTKQQAEWQKKYQEAIETARKGFESIYLEYRRELVGLYGHLWMARCMAAQGEHRRAMGIFQQLMEHENPALAPLQRQVFHFTTLSYMARKEYDQVFNLALPWLQTNSRHWREPAYQGVQMELAKAYIAKAEGTPDPRQKTAQYRSADEILNRLGGYPNQYTGLARREQLRIAAHLNSSGPKARTFNQLFSLANAKLDTLKPDTTADQKVQILNEAKKLFRDAIDSAQPNESIDSINDARVALAYTCLMAGDLYEGALLSEFVAREFPKSTSAPQAGSFAVTAYAMGYDAATARQDQSLPAYPEVDAQRLRSVADYMSDRWPGSKEADSARMTVGRLEYFSFKNYEAAAAEFDKIQPQSPEYAGALALAGGAYWDRFKELSNSEDAQTDELKRLREAAMDRLSKASPKLKAALPGNSIDLQLFLNEAMLAEAYYEAGDDQKALAVLTPVVDKIKGNQLPDSITPQHRTAVLTSALQSYVRQSQLEKAQELVDLIGKQQSGEEASGVTIVFVNLANRMREQLQRLHASGEEDKASEMANSFEGFLDLVSQREAGQNIQTRTILADNYLAIEKYSKAAGLLQQIINDPAGSSEQNRPQVLRAQMLLAKSKRMTGDHESARKLIDDLYRVNQNDLGLVLERGEILEAQGDLNAAIIHWKDIIRRLIRVNPRPELFYTATDRLILIFKKVPQAERRKRLIEGLQLSKKLVLLDAAMPAEWKKKFEKHVKDLEAELGVASK